MFLFSATWEKTQHMLFSQHCHPKVIRGQDWWMEHRFCGLAHASLDGLGLCPIPMSGAEVLRALFILVVTAPLK